MKGLLEVIKKRTEAISTSNRSSFNTNDFLLETLLNKELDRSDVIDIIIAKRIEIAGTDVTKMKSEELDELIVKLYKTSKNGLDTAVSDSQNNSSFSYNTRYDGYKLIKKGSKLSIVSTVSKGLKNDK